MANKNKYEKRRRALKDIQGRSDNPFASPRSGGAATAAPSTYTPPRPMDRRGLTLALSLGLVALISALYVQTAWHKFTVCDDNVYIYEKPQIVSGVTWDHVVWAFSDAHEGNWHPLTWISHMLDWQLFSGGSWEPENGRYKTSWPGGHHLVSMGIHCANAVLLFLALRLMTGTLWPSFVVAALFGIHPLRVESVAWAAERKDVLCGLFWTASMLAYAFYARRRPIHITSLLASFAIVSILTIVFIRLLIFPNLSSEESTLPGVVSGIGVAVILIFTSAWRTQLPEIGIYLLITLLMAMGLMSKSMIVTLPCVFMLLDVWPLGRWKKVFPSRGEEVAAPNILASAMLLLEKVPWLMLAYLDSRYTIYGQNKGVALNSWEGLPLVPRILNAVVSCGEYLRQTVWPAGLAPFYAHPAMIPDGWTREFYTKFWIYSALLLAITAAGILFFRKRPFLLVGWFWYLGALVPVIGIIQVGTQARADRYTYLPMIGVYLMVAWLLKEVADRWPKTRTALAAASVVALIALSAVTFRQIGYWVDSYKLFTHATEVTEKNYFAFNHIGIAYDQDARKITQIDPQEALKIFDEVSKYFPGEPKIIDDERRKAWFGDPPGDFETAIKKLDYPKQSQLLFDYSADNFKSAIDIKPDYDFGNNNLGVYYARRSGPDDLKHAEEYFKGALRSNQRYADAYNNLAIVLARQGKYDEAILMHKAGLGVRDDRASDHNNLCRVYMQKGDLAIKNGDIDNGNRDLENAMNENTVAIRCDPNFVGAWLSREEICFKQKKLEEAGKCVERMFSIDPGSPETRQAAVYFTGACIDLHRPDDAIQLLNQVLKSDVPYPELYNARGLAYFQKGDLQLAKQDFEQVVRIFPQFPGAQANLKAIGEKLASSPK